MPNFEWKILEVESENNVLNHVKYQVIGTENEHKVVTEGYAFLSLPTEVDFKSLIEIELLDYLKRFYIQNNVNSIEYRLSEQLAYLAKNKTTIPPWHVETFKLEI